MQEEGPGSLFASSPRARSPVRGLILSLSTTGLSTRYSYRTREIDYVLPPPADKLNSRSALLPVFFVALFEESG